MIVTVNVCCLRSAVELAGKVYPVYTGFMKPSDLKACASAPNFDGFPEPTRHHQIASDSMKPPMDKWQRPLDKTRVEDIAEYFSDMEELMPNPVLLSENAALSSGISVRPTKLADHTTGKTYDITIDTLSGKPLWILDGQHRINGLAESTQADNPIPVVFLVNDSSLKVYDGGILAKIFAQVSTASEKLKPLHEDWLQFAFRIGPYEKSTKLRKAMETVAILAASPRFQSSTNQEIQNIFYDKIKFNDYGDVTGFPGNAFDCSHLKDLIFDFYYDSSPAPFNEMKPDALAKQLAIAFVSLIEVVPDDRDTNCFIGDANHAREVMRDGFVIGCLRRLAVRGETRWVQFLKQLGFDRTNWDFSWAKSFSGQNYRHSMGIATKIFCELFETGELPPGVPSIHQYFRGNGCWFKLEHAVPTAKGRRPRTGIKDKTFYTGIAQELDLDGDTFVRLGEFSNNIFAISAVETSKIRARPLEFPKLIKPGVVLKEAEHGRPAIVTFVLTLFGGLTGEAFVEITW